MPTEKQYEQLMVTIRCITYNHERYIRQCLESFVMQKTNFRYEAIVHDDASTDRTADIIREYAEKYPEIIKPIFETENQYSKKDGSLSRIMNAHTHGKYVAMCEGDDYWIDSLKLQKQVDFLENNPDYTMCFHNAMEHWENSDKEDKLFSSIKDRDYTGLEVYSNWIIPTASVIFRRNIYDSILYNQAVLNPYFIFGDIVLFLTNAELGKLRGFNDTMSVYRRHSGGLTATKSYDRIWKQGTHYLEIYKVFGNKYKKQSQLFFTSMYSYGFLKSIIDPKSNVKFAFLLKSFSESIFLTFYSLFQRSKHFIIHKKGID